MESNIDPSLLNGSTYLLVNQDLVEDIGYAFTPLTGYSKAEISQKNISEVMQTLFRSRFEPEDMPASARYLFRKTKEVIEVQITSCELENGRILYLFRHRPNFILNSEVSLVNNLIKENYFGVGFYCFPEFRLLRANSKYQDYLRQKYNKDENLLGLTLDDIVPDFCKSGNQDKLLDFCRGGKTVRFREIPLIDSVGNTRYWSYTIVPITEGNAVRFMVEILEDVTDDVLKGKKIEEKNDELKKTIEMKDEMLMLISHELKTPLSVISSTVQTVEAVCKNELSEKVRKYLNKIRQNTYRQMKLVNNILDNTRAGSGLFKVKRTNVDIIQLTKNIIEAISAFAERKKIRISFTSEMDRAIFSTDVDIYERILLNLLSNAIKFTPEGKQIEVRIFDQLIKGKMKICIQVRDNGIGIPSDQKEHIFERFGRADHFTARQAEGTGIGLYLVKNLVSLMDGDIKVDSEEDRGSTFTLFFPASKAGTAAEDAEEYGTSDDRLLNAANIEFSDIYYGAN